MPNSRISVSIAAFLSGFMLIWLLISSAAQGPTNVPPVGSFRFVYLVTMFIFFGYFWLYFYRRPRGGGKSFLDGRTALSGSAFIVGVATGYAFIAFGLIASHNAAEPATGSFAVFVACTLLPIVTWLAVYIVSLYRKNAALRREAES